MVQLDQQDLVVVDLVVLDLQERLGQLDLEVVGLEIQDQQVQLVQLDLVVVALETLALRMAAPTGVMRVLGTILPGNWTLPLSGSRTGIRRLLTSREPEKFPSRSAAVGTRTVRAEP